MSLSSASSSSSLSPSSLLLSLKFFFIFDGDVKVSSASFRASGFDVGDEGCCVCFDSTLGVFKVEGLASLTGIWKYIPALFILFSNVFIRGETNADLFIL